MIAIAILFLILAVGAYSISQLAQHGKLKWKSKNPTGFWGANMARRKYKNGTKPETMLEIAPTTYYYKLFNVKWKEQFPLSTTFLVAFTDGYHASQAVSFLCLALSLSLFSGYSFFWFWPTIPLIHALFYRIFSI